jgi:hypothetical protein
MTSTTIDLDHLPERPRGADTWYEVLDVGRDVDAAGLVLAYDRAIALVEGRHLGGYFLLDPAAIAVARLDIEAAFAILGDEERRRAYDRSLDGDDADGPAAPLSPAARASLPSSGMRPKTPSTPPTTPPSMPPTAAIQSSPPRTLTPSHAGLRFLAPTESAPGTTSGKSSSDKEISSPGVARRAGGIAFAMPQTDVAAQPPAPPLAPPTLVPTATVLPQAAMPPPVASRTSWSPQAPAPPRPTSFVSSNTPRRIEVPSTATPTPPPGIFSIDGEVNGQTLRRLREARRLTIDELAEATKIRRPYLAAIEEQDLDALPSRVYLRGFLTQIARVLRVDKQKLADGYLAFIARFGR